jgi:hypothetical protein
LRHPEASKLRWNLFAYARYPEIFAPQQASGQRKWPQLNEEEKKALKAFVQRVGGDAKGLEPATLLEFKEGEGSDSWAEEMIAFVSTGEAEPHFPAWIDQCSVAGVQVKPFLDTGGGSSFISITLAQQLQLDQQPSTIGVKLGGNCPIRNHGTVTVPLWCSVAQQEFRIPNVAIVDAGVLTEEHQLLLGVAALEQMACVPDVSAGKVFWKRHFAQAAAQTDRQQVLHTTRQPRNLERETLPVYVVEPTSIPSGGSQCVWHATL